LYAIGKPKIRQNITSLAVLVFFVLSLPLTYYFSAFGMSVAYAVSMMVLAVSGWFYLKKILRLNLEMPAVIKMIISSSLAFLVLSNISMLATSLPLIIATALIGGLMHALILIPLKFYSKEDFEVLEMVVKKVPIFRREFGRLFEVFLEFYFKLFPEKG